jgi:putative two-component system response regulator
MPEMNGFEAIELLKANTLYNQIPVIFVTSRKDVAAEVRGFQLGAIDFIIKPFSTPVLINRIKTHLEVDELIREKTADIKLQMEKLRKLKNSMISVLAEMLESRDKSTGGHIERTTTYIKILIEAMIERKIYIDEIANWDLESITSSSRLHDVGKVAISDLILNKPGSLTPDEFETMKVHAIEGERIIGKIINLSGEEDFLHNAKLFAGCHHECWDGTGYPRGLKGEEIPLQGRIMAIVDVYDALTSERPYKPPLTHEQVLDIIMASKGKNFDPQIIEVFFEVQELFEEVAKNS